MAKPIIIPVKADERMLSSSIERGASGAFRKLGASSGAVAPLGRMMGKIRADADEFTKSIEASNARVIAFGASVGVINAVSNAFKKLVETTIRVEKVLTDVNVVLNTSSANLQKFGDGLFKVAKNTAQSFDVVAEAALEFSRQGLGMEETLRRTNDALILTRLTGLKAADSVKGLTAAVNGFARAGLTTTEIINKLAAVDVQFAVSADDLIDALSRTGAVAQQAGMDIDELIGMVTAAQQVTARGGAVIGNAFKTIFTRVQRPETLNTLRALGIAVDDTSGKSLSASKILKNLARDYDSLSQSAKKSVDQQVAGVFQVNILKAAVGDMAKQNSLAARATQISTSATDQAITKNERLNQTIAALSTQSGLALEELAKKIGDIALAPGMRDLVQSFKNIVEGITGVLDGEGTGSTFAKGLLRGIGNILTGPGLVVVGGVFLKLFKDLAVFGVKSLKNLLGLNNAAKQQAALQQGIGQLLAKNVGYEQAMVAAAGNVAKQSAITQGFLTQEVALRQKALTLTAAMAVGAHGAGFRVSGAGALTRKGAKGVPGFAPGGVPNFAVGDISRGTLDIGSTFPIQSAEFGGLGGDKTISTKRLLSKIKNPQLNASLQKYFASSGITKVKGSLTMARGASNFLPPGATSFIDNVYSYSGVNETKLGAAGVKPKNWANVLASAKGMVTSDPRFMGNPVSAMNQAMATANIPNKISLETYFNSGPVEAELAKRMGGKGIAGNFIADASGGGLFTEMKNRMISNKGTTAAPRFGENKANVNSIFAKSFYAKPELFNMMPPDVQDGMRSVQRNFMSMSGAPKGGKGGWFGMFANMRKKVPGFAPFMPMGALGGRGVSNLLGANFKPGMMTRENLMKMKDLFSGRTVMAGPLGGSKTVKAGAWLAKHWTEGAMIGLPWQAAVPGALRQFGMPAVKSVGKVAQNIFGGKKPFTGVNYFAPSFSPLSDAISREKSQVGGMMGISPSSVQTRVIQNASLKSSFNPQGFGVISPTVGQHSFADAARMHRGENLKTANLAPNFAAGDPAWLVEKEARLQARSARIVEQTKIIKAEIVAHSDAAKKTMAKTTAEGTRSGMAVHTERIKRMIDPTYKAPTGPAPKITITPPPGYPGGGPVPGAKVPWVQQGGARGVLGKGAAGGMALGRGVMGAAGAALMSPGAQMAMMAPFALSMARGFIPEPSPQERFFQTPAQRRTGGRKMAQFDAMTEGAMSGAGTGAIGGGIAMLALDLVLAAAFKSPAHMTRIAARTLPKGASVAKAFAGGVPKGTYAQGAGVGLMRGAGWGGAGGAAVGGGLGWFSGAEGKPFLSKKEFGMAGQYLGERGGVETQALTSIRDNVKIASDASRSEEAQFAANTAITMALSQIVDPVTRKEIGKITSNTNLSSDEKGRRILKVQAENAERTLKQTSRFGGVAALTNLPGAKEPAAFNIAAAGIGSMFLGMSEQDREAMTGGLMSTTRRSVGRSSKMEFGGLLGRRRGLTQGKMGGGATGGKWTSILEEQKKIFDDVGYKKFMKRVTGIQGAVGQGSITGLSTDAHLQDVRDFKVYVQDVMKFAEGSFKDNPEMINQIFEMLVFNKDLINATDEDLTRINKILKAAADQATAVGKPVKPSQQEINNFQKKLDIRRALEDRLFQTDLGRTASINVGAMGVTAGTGAINAMMGAGLMTGPTGQRRAARLERAQFERTAMARKAGILEQGALGMGSIFGGGPTPTTMGFDASLQKAMELGNFDDLLFQLKHMEAGGQSLFGGKTIGIKAGRDQAIADKKLISDQIKLVEAKKKAAQSEDANIKAKRKNMEMRLRIAQDIARMNQPGVRAGNAMNLGMAQMAAAGTIAQATEARAANQVGRNAMLTPFMTVNQQRDIDLQSQLRNIRFQKSQIQRASKQGALGLAGGWLTKFSGVAANMREDARLRFRGGGSDMLALRDKKLGEADQIESAQTAFSRGIRSLVESEGGATVKGIDKLSETFYGSIGNINSPEAQNAKTQFAILMTQLKEIAESERITIGDLVDAEGTAKQSRSLATLTDVTNDFRNAFASAMQSVSTESASASDALRNFGIAFFGAINARAIGNIADQVSQGLFDWGSSKVGGGKSTPPGGQQGGFISAQNGIYVSGSRTGDKNPAMLEDGEYVLNRNAVKALGGAGALDTMNFSMAPRFQDGGRNRFGGTPGRGKSYPRKFFDAGPLALESGQNVLGGSEFLNPSRFTDDVVVIDPSGKIVPMPPPDFSKKLRYTGNSSFGLHMTEKSASGKAKHYVFRKDGKGGYLPSHGITIGDVRWPLSDMIEIDATRGGKKILVGKQAGGRLKSPISASGVPRKSLDKILAEYESPSTIMDPRLSGFAHANDPTLQNVRADIRDWHNKQIQKKFEKQAKKDQLMKTIASAAISAGISGAMGKFSEIGGAEKLAKERGFVDSQGRGDYAAMVKDPEFAGELKAMGMQKTKFGYNLKHFGSNLSSRRQAGHGWGGLGSVGSGLDRFGRKFGSDEWVNAAQGAGGWSYKKGSWGRNEQLGGYIDNIPALLTGGEFVMGSSAVRRHGSGFFNRLNRGGRIGYQEGGLVGDQGVVPAENNVSQQTNTSERTNSNTTINITVNSSGEQGEQSSEGQPGTKEKELATKIRGAVLSVLKEEKRTGGVLRDVTGET